MIGGKSSQVISVSTSAKAPNNTFSLRITKSRERFIRLGIKASCLKNAVNKHKLGISITTLYTKINKMMEQILQLLCTLDSLVGSPPFLLTVFVLLFIFKFGMLIWLMKKSNTKQKSSLPLIFLSIILISSILMNSAWILKFIRLLWFPSFDFRIYLFWLRIAWGFLVIQYQALALFIESLVEKKYAFKLHQKIFCTLSAIIFLCIVSIAVLNFNCLNSYDRPAIEWTMLYVATVYVLFPLALSSIFFAVRTTRKVAIPRVLRKQLKLFLQYVFVPYWFLDFLQVIPAGFSPTSITSSYTFTSISNILLTFAVYLCARKIIGLRFLNLHNAIRSPARVIFMQDFKHILEQLSYVTNASELRHITQGFFKELFNIPLGKTRLYVRKTQAHGNLCVNDHDGSDSSLVEAFIGVHDEPVSNFIKQSKILIYDEVAFSNFYEEIPERNAVLSFMEEINADIFLPIYEKNNLVAYIIIERYAHFNSFYSHIEQDEMLIFARYLGNIINLLQNKSLSSLAQQTKDLQEELYRKHQEINQYKESIRSFLRTNKQEHIGIIFYKNRKFIFGNQAAKELASININAQPGHPFTKKIKNLAQLVETYKAPQTVYANDAQGNQLILAGVPHLDSNHVIILIYYPEVSDVLKKQISLLQDPSEWDYLLYLETTQSGKLINQLIPGSGQVLLKFKIELLKLALSKKAILLDLPHEDLIAAAEILHHISLREKIHVLDLNAPVKEFDIAIKLFGINPIFAGNKNNEKPLLSALDGGTLFIKNIHLLDFESQEYLADFIHHGLYRIFKSDQKVAGNVRIICSSNQNLHNLVQEGKFSKVLFAELKHTTVVMPCLLTLPDEELLDLAQGFSEQAIKTQTFEHLLALSDQDKNKLIINRPSSLNELKNKVQQILIKKSKQNDVYQETTFNPAYQVTDPELAAAARLGKQALKDEKIMTMLWNKFKSQNKIATFLDVNRSSINRRCKKYNLE